jgi:pilus assembly protein CpaF
MKEPSFLTTSLANEDLLMPRELGNRKKVMDEITAEVLRRFVDSIEDEEYSGEISETQKRALTEQVSGILAELLAERNSPFSQSEKRKAVKLVLDEITGYGPINELIYDPTVSEIMVNGPDQVYLERDGKMSLTGITFRDDAHVLNLIEKICAPLGRRIDESSPMVDARLSDGSRVNAIIHPLSLRGPVLTIRKFAAIPFTCKDLLSFGTVSPKIMAFLELCVKSRINMLITGGTDSGKTTFLNVISEYIPASERIITIEDAAELQMRQEHVLPLEARPPNIEGQGRITIRDLVINALRMRPDRIIVGEVRGGEALDMLQAMNTGHDGSITTLHANSPRDALARLETMVLMAGMDLPHRAIREQVASAIELIVHTARFPDGSRKVVQITEVLGMEGDTITLQDLFFFENQGIDDAGRVTGRYQATGIIPTFLEKLTLYGETVERDMFAIGEEASPEPLRRRP